MPSEYIIDNHPASLNNRPGYFNEKGLILLVFAFHICSLLIVAFTKRNPKKNFKEGFSCCVLKQ